MALVALHFERHCNNSVKLLPSNGQTNAQGCAAPFFCMQFPVVRIMHAMLNPSSDVLASNARPYQCTLVTTPMNGDRAAGYLVNSSGPMGSVRFSIFEPDVVGWKVYEIEDGLFEVCEH